MLIVLSPAKTLDLNAWETSQPPSQPAFLRQARVLIRRLREFSTAELAVLMAISPKLAEENHSRFAAWKTPFTPANSKPAVLAFRGDVYLGLNVDAWQVRDFEFAQQHLRILSGLYGLLRPLDLIQPYRLEMSTRLSVDDAADLYEFWSERITAGIRAAVREQGDEVLVNLASNEYSQAIIAKNLPARVVTPVFKEERGGRQRVLSFFAKKARGLLASFIIRQRLTRPAEIQAFAEAGYRFQPDQSSDVQFVFSRPQPDPPM